MVVAARTAEEIPNDVKEQLAWDTRVDSTDIDVEVADATVILSGAISDYMTFHSVEEAARYTSGVLEVNNNLTIESQDPPDNTPGASSRNR
jgi:osmotically-inducible protein OsmY